MVARLAGFALAAPGVDSLAGRLNAVGDVRDGRRLDHAVGHVELEIALGTAHQREDARLDRAGAVVGDVLHVAERNVPRLPNRAISPMIMPKSPTRLTMNALLAAVEALFRSM